MSTDRGIVVGSLDIVAAITIIAGVFVPVTTDFTIAFGVLMIIKAIWNYAKFPTPLNPVAGLDLLSGIILIFLYFGISYSLFFIIGIFELIKGGFSLTIGLTG